MRWRSAFPILAAAAMAALLAASAAAQDWTSEWAKTVAAANREGSLVLYSQPNRDAVNFLETEFPKAFPQIKISLSTISSSEFLARIRTERQARKYLWDVALAGAPGAYVMAHDGILDPVLPEILDPDTKNPDHWAGGWHGAFADRAGKYVFAMSDYVAGPWYNALDIPPERAAKLGLKLLLEPDLKGKIAWHDPAVIGAGQPATLLFRVKLGDEGLKRLIVEQRPQFYQDQFQVVEAMARGTAWIGVGPPVRSLIKPYTKAGIAADVRNIGPGPDESLREVGGSALFVFKDRPHPNASRVFVTWLLSKDVQFRLAKALDQASRRTDIPPTTLPDETMIKGATYIEAQREETAPALQAALALVAADRKLVK